MKKAARQSIEAQAHALLSECKLTSPPIDLNKIAKHLRIPIRFESLSKDISGFLYHQDRHTLIVINSKHAKTRQRFTIAHEIGHFALGHNNNEIHVDKTFTVHYRSEAGPKVTSDPNEIHANVFAAALLMPEMLLKEDLKRCSLGGRVDDTTIEYLADRYDVSERALLIRLNSIGLPLTLAVPR